MLNPALDKQINQAVVNFTFDRSGSKKFARATSNNVGKRLAIILDNKIISAPVVKNQYWVVMDKFQEILHFNQRLI